MRLLWFVLAGFLLGFSISTLWEWFHFRRERMKLRDRRVQELEAKLDAQSAQAHSEFPVTADLDEDSWSAPDYQSPGVFLETEELPTQEEYGAAWAPAVREREVGPAPSEEKPRRIQPGSVPRSRDHPDDLSKIKGIGDVYKRRLYAAGIYTWHQIATADEAELRSATRAYPSSNVDEWPVQARELAAKHKREGATYSGPPPTDLMRITGIGPVGMQTLYRAGICTFRQLAAAVPEELADLFPIAVAGDEPDFEGWIEQANRLANAGDED